MYWRYLIVILYSPEGFIYSFVLDPFDGSAGLADKRHVYLPIEVITEAATLTTRGYDHQEPQCRTEPRGKSAF